MLMSQAGLIDIESSHPQIATQFDTDANPAIPIGNVLEILGSTVANMTNSQPLFTKGSGNTVTIEVQVGTERSGPPGDKEDAGLVSFDDKTHNVDTDGWVTVKTNAIPSWANLGLNLTSGVLTVTAQDGSNLSATNPAFVTLSSRSNPGQFTTYTITSNQDFNDATSGAGSDIDENLFGTTTDIAWSDAMPFYIYAVTNNNEDTIQFMIARIPHAMISPTSGRIGTPNSSVSNAQIDFFSFDNITETLFDQNPVLCVGSFRMVKDIGNDWTVQTLTYSNSIQDGIGFFNEQTVFTMPISQMGAAGGKFWKDNGGTAPSFVTNELEYTMQKNGIATVHVGFSDSASDGAGSDDAIMASPFISYDELSSLQTYSGGIRFRDNGSTTSRVGVFYINKGTNNLQLMETQNAGNSIENQDIDAGDGFFGSLKFTVDK